MEESQDKFSLHEIQKKMRREYTQTGRASPPGQDPELKPGLLAGNEEDPQAPIDENGNMPAATAFPRGEADDESLQLRRTMRVLRRHWFMIAFIFIFVPALIFFIDYYLREKSYVTQANYRQLADTELAVLQIGSLELSPPQNTVETMAAMIEEKDVEAKMVELLAAKIGELQSELPALKDLHKKQEQEALIGKLREMVKAKTGTPPDDEKYTDIGGTITTRNLEENLVRLQIRGCNPKIHTLVINCLLKALNYYSSKIRVESIAERLAQLENLRAKNLALIENARKDITRLDEKIGMMDISSGTHFDQVVRLKERQLLENEKLWDLQSRLKLLKNEVAWDRVKKKFKIREDNDIRVVLVEGNAGRMKWRQLEQERAALLTHYTPAHPHVQRLETDIRGVKDALIADGYVNSAGELPDLPSRQEEATLLKIQGLLQDVTLAEMRVKKTSAEIQSARRQEDQDLTAAQMSKEKQKELRDLEYEREELMEQEHNYRLKHRRLTGWIDDTRTTLKQVAKERKFELSGKIRTELESPKIRIDLAIAAILGLVLGCALAFLMESLDNRLHTPFDVYYHLRLNYLGVVPFWGEKEAITISPDKPDSHIAEIFAHLRNNIRYSRNDSPEKCLLVASATQGEGKSTISANLASSYALEGNNVVLIDADLRRPRGHKLINIFKGERNMEFGLCDYLTNEVEFDEIIYSTAVPGLSLIPAGSRVRNPAKLMGSPEMMTLIKQAEENFDIVILDCPAVLPVVDATTLSGHVRGVLMVIAAEEVEIGAVRMALYRLRHVGSPIVGAVLNKVRERSTSYYYYGYRYRSGYYYSPYIEPNTSPEDQENTA